MIRQRLQRIVPVFLLVTGATAFMLDLLPGDPAVAIYGDQVTPEQSEVVRAELGLDKPVLTRYVSWLGDIATGDFGTSFRTRQPVLDAVLERLPVTVEIALLAIVIALVVSIPLGAYTALRADGKVDRAVQVVTSASISSPSFLTGVLLVFAFAVTWQLFPVTGWVRLTDDPVGNLRSAFLPALTLAIGEIAVFVRLLRSDMIVTLEENYIIAARSRGLSTGYILVRHALRPSSFSLVTLAGLAIGRTIGGAVLVEHVFALPGVGNLLIQSVVAKDFVVVQGVVLLAAVVYITVNALVDVTYGLLDPRVRASRVA